MVAETEMTDHSIAMTNSTTTIDPSVLQSRILQSSSLATAAAKDNMEDDDDEMNTSNNEVEQPTFKQLSAMESRGGRGSRRGVYQSVDWKVGEEEEVDEECIKV